MKKFQFILFFFAAASFIFPASVINNITVHASKDVDCNINYDESTGKITGVSVRADVLSFDSGNSNRDSHMGEVVDALEYPDVAFLGDSIQYLKNDTLKVTGKLTFHNVTKIIPVKVVEKFSSGETVFNGGFYISLTEFNIDRPKLLLIPVEDKLTLQFHIVVPKVLKKT